MCNLIRKIIKALVPYGILYVWRRFNWSTKFKMLIINMRNRCIKTRISGIDVPDNGVLLIEVHPFHAEVLPGLAKYLIDLGYCVDVVMASSARNTADAFVGFKNDRLRIYAEPARDVMDFLYSNNTKKYKHIILNTYGSYLSSYCKKDINAVCMIHDNILLKSDDRTTNKRISLVKMDCFDREPPTVVNAHYFGEINLHKKSKLPEFLAFGTEDHRREIRNTNLIVKICGHLAAKNITEYRIKIVGDFDVPKEYAGNIRTLGFLNFPEMYKEISESDFLLALIDPAAIQYTNKASGTYQLSYGFIKPIILHKKFAATGNFTDENSILYDDIYTAVEKAISMTSEEYDIMTQHLEKLEETIYETSLKNLKSILDSSSG